MQFKYKDDVVLKTDTPSTLGLSEMDVIVWEVSQQHQSTASSHRDDRQLKTWEAVKG